MFNIDYMLTYGFNINKYLMMTIVIIMALPLLHIDTVNLS